LHNGEECTYKNVNTGKYALICAKKGREGVNWHVNQDKSGQKSAQNLYVNQHKKTAAR
jgi:hypothetical protein